MNVTNASKTKSERLDSLYIMRVEECHEGVNKYYIASAASMGRRKGLVLKFEWR